MFLNIDNRSIELTPAEPVGIELIGREVGCTICLQNDQVSKKHAVIVVTSEGLWVRDWASTNGVWVNGKRVETAPLQPGNTIRFGKLEGFLSLEPVFSTTPAASEASAPTNEPPKGTLEDEDIRNKLAEAFAEQEGKQGK